MMIRFMSIFLFGAMVLATSCKPAMSAAAQEAAYSEMLRKVKSNQFRLEMNTAYPFQTNAVNQVSNAIWRFTGNTANRVNLDGGDFIELEGDTLKGDLAYIGERRISSPYNSTDIGIKFEGVPREFKVIEDPKHKYVEIEANVSDRIENYDLQLRIFTSGKVSVYINSSTRTPIRYDGVMVMESKIEN